MEPLKSMKPQQVLTEESIKIIKRAITTLEDIDYYWPSEKQSEVIEDLKSIITDTE